MRSQAKLPTQQLQQHQLLQHRSSWGSLTLEDKNNRKFSSLTANSRFYTSSLIGNGELAVSAALNNAFL